MRRLFRHLQAFESLFTTQGIDTITDPDGDDDYNLFDLLRLYQVSQRKGPGAVLSARQRQAIELFLYRDLRETDVAVQMGVSAASPVAIYATQGLKRLVLIWEDGLRPPGGEYATEDSRHDETPARSLPGAGGCGRRAA